MKRKKLHRTLPEKKKQPLEVIKGSRRASAQSPQEFPRAETPTVPVGVFRSSAEQRKAFWDTFIRAVEAEPLQVEPLRGASGLVHPATAIGFDRTRKRLLVISGDPDGRSAALAQADIQAANQDFKVIFARPIAVNLAKIAETLASFFGKAEMSQRDIERFSKLGEGKKQRVIAAGIFPAIQAVGYAALNAHATLQDVLIQLSHVQFIVSSAPTQSDDGRTEVRADTPVIKFGSLVALDPAELDRQTGVCSVPLYEFSGDEAEVFHSGSDIERARELLMTHHIFQYFFPAPDSLALALMERNLVPSSTLMDWLKRPPEIGHPLGASELVTGNVKLDEIVDTLKERGFAVEGEIGLELTESGKVWRATVRFKPREAFLSKLSNVFSLKVDLSLKDLKDLLK